MNKRPFGLDIGVTTLKLVWLEQKKEGYYLRAANSFPTPPKGVMSESPLDEEEMAQAIQKAINSAKIETKFVNVALAENQVYTKVLEMPVLSDRELRSAIYWEAEQYIPVPLNNITLTWNVLDKPQNGTTADKMQVLMVGAPSVLISKYKTILGMAGLTITSMETEILAVLRSLIVGQNFPPTLVVNIGALNTSLAIVRNNIMVFTYSISVGGAAINRAIATDFGMTQQQAEEYKKTYGVSSQFLGGKIGQATTPILNAVVAEVKKSLAFYQQKYKDLPISQIILTGGSANLPGIDAFFAQNSGIETVVANPWKILAPQQVPKDVIDNAPDFVVAVGLAMRNYE